MDNDSHTYHHAFQDASDSDVASPSAVESSAPLPEGYGDNRLIILPRDPFAFFAYWEITSERIDGFRAEQGGEAWEQGALVLRVYDVSDSSDGLAQCPFFDVETQKTAQRFYVTVEKSGRAYQVELGVRLPDGRFFALLRSNRIRLPVGRVSEKTESQWMAVGYGQAEEGQWDRYPELAAGLNEIGRGSAEISRTMAQRWEFLKSVFSGSSAAASSWSTSSSSHPNPNVLEETR